MTAPLYRLIATAVDARNNSQRKLMQLRARSTVEAVLKHGPLPKHHDDAYNNAVNWVNEWEARLERMEAALPSGSGFDSGTQILLGNPGESRNKRSIGERLVLKTAFHHMNEHGCYDGWTEHLLIVEGSLMFGCNLRITGRNRNDIKDYMQELFDEALRAEYDEAHFVD